MSIQHKLSHPEVRRFGKYGLVGISSFAVGFIVFNALYFTMHWLTLANAVSYILSVLNGFILNRAWTFKERRRESVWVQAAKFSLVNIVGYTINIAIVALFLGVYSHFTNANHESIIDLARAIAFKRGGRHYSFIVVNAAGLAATAVVTIWNFLINRAWSFGA